MTSPSLPNKSNLDSSLQRTVLQKFSGLADIILAKLRHFNRLALLTYDRFRATRSNSPYSLARRLIVLSDMCTPSSCSSSVFLRSHFSLRLISQSTRIVVSRFLPRPSKLPKHSVASYLLIIFWTEVLGRSGNLTLRIIVQKFLNHSLPYINGIFMSSRSHFKIKHDVRNEFRRSNKSMCRRIQEYVHTLVRKEKCVFSVIRVLKIVRFVPGRSILSNKKTLSFYFVLNKTRTTYNVDLKISTQLEQSMVYLLHKCRKWYLV